MMKSYAIRLAKYLLFLLAAFAIERAAFLLAHFSEAAQSPIFEVVGTFVHALHLDLSTACYFFAIPFVILTLQLVVPAKWPDRILSGYTLVVILIIVLSGVGNLILYPEWSTKLNYKIWAYLGNPAEVFRTASLLQSVGGGMVVILVSGGYFYAYRRWSSKPIIQRISKLKWTMPIILVVGLFVTFIGVRGKLTGIPISQSSAYFSKNQILNEAAVNTQWHLAKSTLRFAKSNRRNMFACMPEEEAEAIVNELFRIEKDTTLQVLKTERPNVVIILLESWSADLIESLGGRADITPNFHELEREGILFTQLYAAGRRSQEGNSSIISGFPPIPVNVVTDNFEKYPHLNSLANSFKKEHYATSYLFGGDLTYGNLKAYTMTLGFDRVLDETDFSGRTPRGRLSIFDEYVYSRHLEELRKEKSPFFAVMFTGSSHSPYDVPQTLEPLTWDVPELPYLNSARYADKALGDYIAKAKKEGWYDNTLFILVADHSHRTYKQWDYHSAGYQHIPMLWLGGALKDEWKGEKIDKLCSYLDLPLSLLKQLGFESSEYQWSNNIFNPYSPSFAPFQNNLGLGWITPEGSLSYDASANDVYQCTFPDEASKQRALRQAKAYLQVSYQRYLEL